MSPAEPSSTCVLQALDVLSNTSRATLLRYKAKLQAVVQKLDDPEPAVSATPPRPLAEELVELLRGELPTIKTLLSKVRVIDITEPEWTKEDPRIVDIQSSEKPKDSPEAKLRTLLSQRSLAKEFQIWESSSSKGKAKRAKRLGQVNTFISVNANRFFDRSAARQGIQHGQKLFKCEKSLGVGFSAILIFYRDKIRRVRNKHLINLKHAIDEQHNNAISNNQDSIKEIAKRQEKWLNERQIEYNAWCAEYTETAASTARAKRRLPGLPLPPSKRSKAQKPHGDPLQTVSSLGASAADPGPRSTNFSSAVAPLLPQQTQYDVHEQSQRPPNPPLSQNNVGVGVCDGFNRDNIDDTNGRAKGNTILRSVNSSMQETQRSVLHREESITEEGENGLSQSSELGPSPDGGHSYVTNGILPMGPQSQALMRPHDLEAELDVHDSSTLKAPANDAFTFSTSIDPNASYNASEFSNSIDPNASYNAPEFSNSIDPNASYNAFEFSNRTNITYNNATEHSFDGCFDAFDFSQATNWNDSVFL